MRRNNIIIMLGRVNYNSVLFCLGSYMVFFYLENIYKAQPVGTCCDEFHIGINC